MMKKIILFLSTIFIGLTFMISCSEDELTNYKDLKLSANSLSIKQHETKTIKILSGNGGYKLTPNDKIKTEIKNNIISITGKEEGVAKITLTDSKREKQLITVTVQISDMDFGKIKDVVLKKDSSKEIPFEGGSGEYEIKSSKKEVATAVVKDGKLVVTGKGQGTAMITIVDKKTKKEKSIMVEVTLTSPDVAVDKTEVTIEKGGKDVVEITTGSGKYEVKSSKEEIATAELKAGTVVIKGLKKGTAYITVTDKATDKKATIKVTVSVDALVVNKEKIAIKQGEKETVTIKAGSGKYTVVSKTPAVATVKYTEGKDEFEITGVKAGDAEVVVTDTEANASKTIVVKVTLDPLKLTEKAVTLGKGSKSTVVATGGFGNITVASKDKAIATATKDGRKVIITGVKKGETKVIITDEAGQKKEINVTVSVDEFALLETETEITLRKEDVKELHIVKGSGNYKVNSNNTAVATVVLEGTTVKITGVEGNKYTAKTAKITITDTEANESKEITVKVFKKLSLGRKVIDDIKQGDYRNTQVVEGDREHITVTIDNEEIASYEIVEVNGFPEIKFTGLKPGTTFATVTDGSEIEKIVAITVKAIDPVKIVDLMTQQEVSNTEITVGGEPGIFTLQDGSDQYKISYNPENQDIVSAEIEYGSLTVMGLKGGMVTLIITDTISGHEATLQITSIGIPLSTENAPFRNPKYIAGPKTIGTVTVEGTFEVKPDAKFGVYISGGTKPYEYSFEPNNNLVSFNEITEEGLAKFNVGSTQGTTILKISTADGSSKYYEIVVNVPLTVEVDSDGVVRRKSDGTEISGDIVLPNNAKTIPSNDDEFTPFQDNQEIVSIDFGGVTSIGKMSVKSATGLTTVKLRNVTNIGMAAFFNCTSLSNVYCYMTTPPSLAPMAFKNVTAVLHVPTGTKQAYIDAGFTTFSDIVEDAN